MGSRVCGLWCGFCGAVVSRHPVQRSATRMRGCEGEGKKKNWARAGLGTGVAQEQAQTLGGAWLRLASNVTAGGAGLKARRLRASASAAEAPGLHWLRQHFAVAFCLSFLLRSKLRRWHRKCRASFVFLLVYGGFYLLSVRVWLALSGLANQMPDVSGSAVGRPVSEPKSVERAMNGLESSSQ